MTVRIEKSVPIPTDNGRSTATAKYPFEFLEIGDSFFAPDVQHLPVEYWARKLSRKFTIRKDKSGSGVRCWRIA